MQVHRTIIHQVYVLHFDELPFSRLLLRSNVERLRKLFEFGNLEVGPSQAGDFNLAAQVGILRDDMGEIPILRLAVEERRILMDVEGTSADADRAIDKVRHFLADLAGRPVEGFLLPIAKAEESEIIARMDFSADKLIDPAFLQFVVSALPAAARSDLFTPVVSPNQVSFVVRYSTEGQLLDDYRISLSRKEFIVGPRPGHLLSEQIFYSKAPVDTETHKGLLANLEQIYHVPDTDVSP